ncbi:MAG: urate hydroxylase PuuD [Pseudomonadota bacterium]
MDAYLVEWLNLAGRWLHFVAGVAWIGSSFYFVWLDNHLQPAVDPADDAKGVGGEVWSVHGGGFYHAQKYRVAPPALPETLHWFKWEAYTTWLSGMFLLALVYWYAAEVYLIDPAVADLSHTAAVGIGAAFLAGGWIIYDVLCKSPLGQRPAALGAVIFALLVAAAWGLCELFSGRGAYIHFGAMLGTIMVANVFFVIIPGQRRMVEATANGRQPDPADGLNGKQRSVHNTYFTLPVLFVMISNHYALTYGHEYNWLILIGMLVAGALIRVYFVARHKGNASPVPVVVALVLLLGIAAAIAPRPTSGDSAAAAGVTAPKTFEDVAAVIAERCTSCHAAVPTYAGFTAAPGGVVFDTPDQIARDSARIHQQAVLTRIMPIGNLTGMKDDERALIDRWYRDGGTTDWIESH